MEACLIVIVDADNKARAAIHAIDRAPPLYRLQAEPFRITQPG